MAFKFSAAFALISLAAVSAAPYQLGGDDGGDGGGGHELATSHQFVQLVSHDDGHDDGHGHEHGHGGHDDGHDSHAEYVFHYGVEDKKTGDIKEQSESRHGDKVQGHYELVDADGHKRTVHYTADKHNGFQATVHIEKGHGVGDGGGGHGGHTSYHGGHAEVEQHSSGDHEGGGEDHGYGEHDHGHGGSSSSHYSVKQEHGVATHHGGDDHSH